MNNCGLGSRVTLVTKSEVRYEGILFLIDAKENTIVLAKVKILGTEDRRVAKEVLPREEIYDYVSYKINELKEFQVINGQNISSNFPFDSAVVQVFHSGTIPYNVCGQNFGHVCSQSFPQHLNQMTYSNVQPCASHPQSNKYGTMQPAQKKVTIDASVQVSGQLEKADKDSKDYVSRESRRPLTENSRVRSQFQRGFYPNRRFQKGRGGFRRGRGRGRSNSFPRNTEILRFDCEYDFELANAEFKELENKLSKNVTEPPVPTSDDVGEDTAGYDKDKSFFDNISCEASRSSKGIPRFDWRVEKKLNVETFGVPVSPSWLRRRRGRGGFRRGGRGRENYAPNKPEEKNDVLKIVTFEEQLVTAEIERPETPSMKTEDIPIIEMVTPKEAWEEPSEANKEQWK